MTSQDHNALRYARHHSLPAIGPKGQEKLGNGSVLIVGAGGLGATAALYLTTAGVGKLFINDFDTVDATNLPRQVLFRPDDVGHHKAEAAVQNLREWNPAANLVALPERLSRHGLEQVVAEVDVVVDCSDNFGTRWLLNEVCFAAKRALVSGAAIRMEGQVSVFRHDQKTDHGCYRCLYSEDDETLEDCAGQGILAPVAGTIGCMLATETIKVLTQLDSELAGKLWVYDAAAGSGRSMKIAKNPQCPVCSVQPQGPHIVR